jgi:DNA-binding phage protein
MLSPTQLKEILLDRNLSHVAREIGVTKPTIYRFMRIGKCSISTLEKLNDYFSKQEKKELNI